MSPAELSIHPGLSERGRLAVKLRQAERWWVNDTEVFRWLQSPQRAAVITWVLDGWADLLRREGRHGYQVDCRPACPLHVPFELAVIRITPACLEILADGGEALDG